MKFDYKSMRCKVKNELKCRGIFNREAIDEFTSSCFDEYRLSIENGEAEQSALRIALDSLNETLDSNNYERKVLSAYNYSLIVSSVSFTFAIIVAIIGWLEQDVLGVFGIIYPLYFVISLGFLIYAVVTYKRRSKIDYLISIFVFIGSLVILIESLIYFYRIRTGDFYYTLDYDFPGLLSFNYYTLSSMVLNVKLFEGNYA